MANERVQQPLDQADEAVRRLDWEVGCSRTIQLAAVLLEHYLGERAEAQEHLDFAVGEFQEMKMQPSLQRALRHKEILRA